MSCWSRSEASPLNRLLAFQGLDEGRDGTIEGIRDGAEQGGFAVEDLAVRGDGLGAGEQEIAFRGGGAQHQRLAPPGVRRPDFGL